MDRDPILEGLDTLLQAIAATQEVASGALALIREHRERVEELAEDVADLGLRLSAIEAARRNEHSLGVTTRTQFRTLDELAEVLRHELHDVERDLTARIDSVHVPALRALTDRHERTKPA